MEEKLKRRKLDALRRGVHRLSGDEALCVTTHAVGIGKAGIGALVAILRDLEPAAPKFHALAVDIGGQDMVELRSLAASIPAERAEVTMIALAVPPREFLLDALQHYPEFLALEYPRYYWAAGYQPWLSPSVELPKAGGHFSRAIAKAIYGFAYYSGMRTMRQALRSFAADIEAANAQAVVAILFGLGGGTGGGIAIDLARHLSNVLFGRRVLVAGIGIAPCDGDLPVHRGAQLFPLLNELDCLDDEGKNRGIVASCGELFRNPFTAGFLVVPQQHVWGSNADLAQTQARADQEIATLLAGRGGGNLWETLRLLNWVAAPSTQHSAARTPWGAKWIHMLGYADAYAHAGSIGAVPIGPDLPYRLGLLAGYAPEFIEMRVSCSADGQALQSAAQLEQAFAPDVPPQLVDGGRPGSVQFILPSIRKTDLGLFYAARDAYDLEPPEQRLLDHSMLLEQGVILSEPSRRIEGMAGASLPGSESWIAVPLRDLRGAEEAPRQTQRSEAATGAPVRRELGHAL